MPKVLIGQVFSLVNCLGVRGPGGRRLGGIAPPKSSGWKGIVEMNWPVFELSEVSQLIDDRYGREFGMACAGVFWAFASITMKKSQLLGLAVRYDGDCVVPLSEQQIANALKIGLPLWRRASALLMDPCGVIAVRRVELDVDEDNAKYYAARKQLELPFELSCSRARSRNVRPRANVDVTNVTGRNEDEDEDVTSLPNGSGSGVPTADPVSRFSEQMKALGPDYETTLIEHVRLGRMSEARMAFVAGLTAILKGGEADTRDRRDWGRAFVNLWNAGGGRLAAAFREAQVIAADENNKNPAAVFNAYLSCAGMRRRR